jgi:NADPH2:quinone reductase
MGTLVSFGQSIGPVPLFDIGMLGVGSRFLTRPSITTYTARREDLLAHAKDLFEVVESGLVKVHTGKTYSLADAVTAHGDIESRRTTGSLILIP